MLPNFLIIGATKAGTTSLHHYLNQHPEIFMCKCKETNFFAQESSLCLLRNEETITSREEYEQLFAEAGNAKAIGETSPAYLAVVPEAPQRILNLIPEAKMIAILRDPSERAYSHYLMRRQQGRELRSSFAQCIEEPDIDPEHSYKSRGFYGMQLEQYFACFPKAHMRIFLYEELRDNAANILQHIFSFLDVDTAFRPDTSARHNENPPAEPIPTKMREHLVELYQNDIRKLQRLLDKDLTRWLRTT